jgi:hypothetical protein
MSVFAAFFNMASLCSFQGFGYIIQGNRLIGSRPGSMVLTSFVKIFWLLYREFTGKCVASRKNGNTGHYFLVFFFFLVGVDHISCFLDTVSLDKDLVKL